MRLPLLLFAALVFLAAAARGAAVAAASDSVRAVGSGLVTLAPDEARVAVALALSLDAEFFTVFLLVAMDRSTLGS